MIDMLKNKVKNQHGFTLIELLVVIVIIGIITVLALPGVQQLQARNRNKKYETYSDTLESAGKLYTDSYADDMFGMTGNGCFDIHYEELIGKALIKDFSSEGISCNDPSTFVQVKRENGKYTYDVSLKCSKGGTVVYENILSDCGEQSLTASDIPVISVDVENVGGYDEWSQSKKIVVKVEAKNGFIANSSISYGFTQDLNTMPAMKLINFNNDTNVYELSYDFTESAKNGLWHLVIDGDNLIDLSGHCAADKIVENLKFDNVVPVVTSLTNPSNGEWVGDAFFASNSYKLTGVASDQGDGDGSGSGIYKWEYRYPSSDNVWHVYSDSSVNTFVTPEFTTDRNEIIELRACDKAWNCSSAVSTPIKIDRNSPSCSISLNGTVGNNGWYKNSAVTVTMTTSDTGGSDTAGYNLTTSATPSYNGSSLTASQGNTSGITWYGYVKDTAGNVSSCNSESFKVDTTAPNISFSFSGSTSTVTCSDSDSGVVTATSTHTISSSALTHSYTCTNKAGMTKAGSQKYKWNSCKTGSSSSCVGGYSTCYRNVSYCEDKSVRYVTVRACYNQCSGFCSGATCTYEVCGTKRESYSCWDSCKYTENTCSGGWEKA